MAVLNHQFSHLVFLFVYGIVRVRLARKEASACTLQAVHTTLIPFLKWKFPKARARNTVGHPDSSRMPEQIIVWNLESAYFLINSLFFRKAQQSFQRRDCRG